MADVRETALDLLQCALYAELALTLVTKVGLPPEVVSRVTSDILTLAESGRGKRHFGCKSTITLVPAGSSTRREAMVILQRGSQKATVSAAEAREMARVWLTAAEATESDQMVTEALTNVGQMGAGWVENFFSYLRQVRGGSAMVDRMADELLRDAEAEQGPGAAPGQAG
ncbi:hypothetical protein [Nonomuraea sp. NPDC023979]|uniref:hypothetical protein n=1 Tax=Nonomuraea sp. NPDC023979 TaxID=3154796 RepID=UPI0033CC3EA3